MQHTIKIGGDGIAYVNIIGYGDAKVAEEFVAQADKILSARQGGNLDAIVVMTQSGTSDYQGIKIYQGFLKDERLGKIAFIISNEVIKAFTRLAIGRRKEVKFCDSVEEAKKWIKK